MNYPIWDVPARGLLIALIAVFHVFISHFAVGGGLFLVLTECKARREGDAALLGYVRFHSRFFILLTLVMGAITGVAIWFVIGLVHPQATSSLIGTFVWVWAIEWTFFATEIAASMVYYYGWDRLPARTHLAVGWIYCVAAWLSLVVINGILTYMLTPGAWVMTRNVRDAFFNPTYWPALLARSFMAIGLAGLYALLTASWLTDGDLKRKIARYAGVGWILPMTVALPLSLVWFLSAAARGGAAVRAVMGAQSDGVVAIISAVMSGANSGYPIARRAALVVLLASGLTLLVTLLIVIARSRSYGRPLTGLLIGTSLVAVGGGEWVREDLRKPYVIGRYMFVNGVRLPASSGVPQPPASEVARFGEDRFTVSALNRTGVLKASPWVRPRPAGVAAEKARTARTEHEGQELFRALCTACHTLDGYVAIRPLVRGKTAADLDTMLTRLASPVDASGRGADWDNPPWHLRTWRDRQMPPFVGTADERRALASYLALLGGAAAVEPGRPRADADGGNPVIPPIPQPDPVPLAAPHALLWGLLLLMFFLHLVSTNLLFGGSVLGAIARWRSRSGTAAHQARLAHLAATALPAVVAATVSLGVAALLFLQVLYGRVFFVSSVLMAWPWLGVVPMLIIAYYLAYLMAFREARFGGAGTVMAWLIVLLVAAIGFIYTNNMSLMLQPQEFVARYLAEPSGRALNFADGSVVPRYLHVAFGAIGVAGLAVAVVGLARRGTEPGFGAWAVRYGSAWFALATIVNIFAGLWWLMVLPRDTLLQFMGRDTVGTTALVLGILFGFAALALVMLAVVMPSPAPFVAGGVGSLVLTLVAMLLTRDALRRGALAAADFKVVEWVWPQWGPIGVFVVLLAAAIATIAWMVRELVLSSQALRT